MLMDGWDFFMLFARNSAHSLGLVWPWLLAMACLEWISPGRRLHLPTWVFNALYLTVYLTVSTMVLYPVAQLIAPKLPINFLKFPFEEQGWMALSGLVFLYLLMFDFFFYWFHRAQHRWPVLWRFHRFHHSDCNVSVTSAFRHHWLEELTRYFFLSVPLIMLVDVPHGLQPTVGILIGVVGMFIHWNTSLSLGWLTGVVVGPQYHRIHHSFDPAHIDKNFSVLFPFWDRLFGTQCMPVGNEYPQTGVPEVARPNGWRQLLPWPPKEV